MEKIISYILNPFKIFRVLFNKIYYFYRDGKLVAEDSRHNNNVPLNKPFILIVREHGFRYNQHFLNWVSEKYPQTFQNIYLGRIPGNLPPFDKVFLLIPWFQDPLRERNPELFALARNIEDKLAQKNVAIINPVSSLSSAIKSSALKLLREQGFRCARVAAIDDPLRFNPEVSGLHFPFIIRGDIGHGSTTYLIRQPSELKGVAWKKLNHPVAIEFINVISSDGYYRKYRMMVIGEICLPRHLLISKDWNIHLRQRTLEAWALKEEREFLEKPHEKISQQLVKARRLLGFDIVAFDYGIDQNGEMIIWEPNPFPLFWISRNETLYSQNDQYAIEKIYETLFQYYLKRSGINNQ